MLKRARPLVALLFHVLLLHVSVLGGGMACAPAWASLLQTAQPSTAAAPDATAHHGAGHDAHQDARHGAPDHASPDVPAPHPDGGATTHCMTAAGCAAVAVASPEVTPATLAQVDASAARVRVSAPAFTRAAPEPPPPRG